MFSKSASQQGLLYPALMASILLNLLLGATWATPYFMGHMLQPKAEEAAAMNVITSIPHAEYMVDWMAQHLKKEDGEVLREVFAAQDATLKQIRADMRAASDNATRLFEAESNDKTAFKAAMEQLVAVKARLHQTLALTWQQAYNKLSPEGRRRIIEIRQRPM